MPRIILMKHLARRSNDNLDGLANFGYSLVITLVHCNRLIVICMLVFNFCRMEAEQMWLCWFLGIVRLFNILYFACN